MEETGKLTVVCIALIAALYVVIALPLAYYAGKQQRIVEMVKGGVSPLEAGCALDLDGSIRSACDAVIARKE